MNIPIRKNNGYSQVAGKTFGHWTVIEYGGLDTRNNSLAMCRCDCGTRKTVKIALLKNGRSTSCGCMRGVTHGMTGTVEHWAWKNIHQRCYNPNRDDYERFGAKGTRMCMEWRNSFESFFRDMGKRPLEMKSIDRINGKLHYSCGHCEECLDNGWPMNCRWADDFIQANNQSDNVFIEHNGKRMTCAQWERELGLPTMVLSRRIQRGWTHKEAITIPLGQRKCSRS